MSIASKIQEFNKIFDRIEKGSKFLDDPQIPLDKKEKHLETFQNLLSEFCIIGKQLENAGFKLTDHDYQHGIGRGDPI